MSHHWVDWFEILVRKSWSNKVLDWNKTLDLSVRKVCRIKQSFCGKQRRQRQWNDFSKSSYYTRSRRTVKLNFETRESQMTFLLSTIYSSALVIISLPTPTFHCMFTWLPSLLCISCAGGTESERQRQVEQVDLSGWTGRAMHWLSFYFGNIRETWTQNFNPRDALFLLFNFRDLCVGPPPPPPPLYPPLSSFTVRCAVPKTPTRL